MGRLVVFLAAMIGTGLAMPDRAGAASYQQVYAFRGGAGGAQPVGRLTVLGGFLYGATYAGGGTCRCGTVYRLTAGGVHRPIYDFAGGAGDGAHPEAGVVALNGTLYGTTLLGGANTCSNIVHGCGTVYRLTPAGAETVLHTFVQGSGHVARGYQPAGDLLVEGKSVWGVASFLDGVFQTRTSGLTRSFAPVALRYGDSGGLVDVGGVFYGVAFEGAHSCGIDVSGGSVYAITQSGVGSTVHAFQCGADGKQPTGTLLYANGLLYGTTDSTIFSITTSGVETVLYHFAGGDDATGSGFGFTALNGVFYGVSGAGGGTGCGGQGCGTIYSVTPDGVETELYRFQGGADGEGPDGRLLAWQGALYGVTSAGGSAGAGTVFRFTP
jgi:uncharacterized repeat protein (TIGR03803 family)